MSEITTVGLDLAKTVFQAHGADASGRAVLRKKLRRDQVLDFFGRLAPCVVAMKACGDAHSWGREIGKPGHEVRLIPPLHQAVRKAPEKRRGRCRGASREAAQRPTMHFVPVKSEATQGAAMVFRIRELLIRQRTQAINAPCRRHAPGVTRPPGRVRPDRAAGGRERRAADRHRREP